MYEMLIIFKYCWEYWHFVCFSKQLIRLSLATSSNLPSVGCVFNVPSVFKGLVVWFTPVLDESPLCPSWEISDALSIISIMFAFGMLNKTRSTSTQPRVESRNALNIWWGHLTDLLLLCHLSCAFYFPETPLLIPLARKLRCSYCALQWAVTLAPGTKQQKDKEGKITMGVGPTLLELLF